MASSPEDDNIFFNYSPQDTSGRNNKQKQYNQDLFPDSDRDSSSKALKTKTSKPENKVVTKALPYPPPIAVPEKIVFCIDTTLDVASGYLFEDSVTEKQSDTHSVRNEAIKVFIANKLAIAKETEFALVALKPGKSQVLCPLSSDLQQFMNCLTKLNGEPVNEASDYDITPMFSSVLSVIDIPQQSKLTSIPPSYVVRLILVYGNSFLEPGVKVSDEYYKMFITSPFCILDVFYLHDKLSDNNKVEEIFKSLGKIISENSYLLENGRNVTTLFNKMAKFLAHPYQRVQCSMWQF